MPLRRMLMLVAATMCLSPAPARADWYISPLVGGLFGGQVVEAPAVSVGAAAGWTGPHGLGVEVDLADSPNFFGVTATSKVLFSRSRVTTLMFNGVVDLPWRRYGTRPYFSGGIGLIRSSIGEDADFIRGTNNNFGFNVGGGATSMIREHVGARGDLRYVRTFQPLQGESEFFSFGSTDLDFWRASGGVVFRF